MRVFRWVWVVLLAISLLGISQQTVKIGFLAPLTGFAAADGFSALNGALLAVEYINQHGGINGIPLELVYYDDACAPDQAAALTRRLIEKDKIVILVSGSYSSPTRAMAVICQEVGIPLIAAYAVHPGIAATGEYCWQNGLAAIIQGKAGAYLAVEKLGARRIALLVMNNDYGISLAESFKATLPTLEQRLGIKTEIVYEKRYPLGETEFREYLAAIKTANPDLLYAPAYYNEAANLARQFRETGLQCWLLGDEGWDSPKFLELAGEAAEGVIIVTDLDRDSERPLVRYFLQAYAQKTGIPADMVGASAFDAVMVAAHALRMVGTDPKAIIDYLSKVENFEDAVTGPILCYQDRRAVRPIEVQVVQNGMFRHFHTLYEPEVIYFYPKG